ncbi:MAG: polysaccharide pyruvyl transferase family protein [Planctomycetia bacterium]|nr:polysaccharide pyruvyl transferase family protein [Planctomycetia bacterium]
MQPPDVARATFHPVRYWRQEHATGPQNFGDFLAELFLDELFVLPSWPADAYYLVGSVIRDQRIRRTLSELHVEPTRGCVAFWGCGLRGPEGLSAEGRARAAFFGVRGPLTRDALALPADTVIGDPGLLLPLLVEKPVAGHGRTLCVTHFHEPRQPDDIKSQTGVDDVLSAAMPPSLPHLREMVRLIAGAEFVLSGSLHAAIAACAYGVPFAFFDSGYVDIPFKWSDFAASVCIPPLFARTLAEGRAIHRDGLAATCRPPALSPLLHAAPFQVLPDVLLRALVHDGWCDAAAIAEARRRLAASAAAATLEPREAQRRWLEREQRAFEARRAAAALQTPRQAMQKPSDST